MRPEGACYYCGRDLKEGRGRWEHKTPLGRGGADSAANRVRSCNECDKRKGILTAEEFLAVRHDDVVRKRLIRQVFAELRGAPPLETSALRKRRRKRARPIADVEQAVHPAWVPPD
jgi:hypothetical protein